ncbi:hypothetical protein HKI87_06g41350 [Chloropicon roscoffensis]|uniref:Uncharacterized protein n=1 Tax=Chloropicon roscoffensis TaxID=1461544 RepID=A0A7S3C602_9CHLO|mmetsp:Transcript_10092/g.30785  ORF Transcript_10092/g.30785 Transcript_10092/m.30785 type:complete len:400 (+) Transcript_10092:250-1449(+)
MANKETKLCGRRACKGKPAGLTTRCAVVVVAIFLLATPLPAALADDDSASSSAYDVYQEGDPVGSRSLECTDERLAQLRPDQVFLGVVDSSDGNQVEFSWHFPDDLPVECVDRFQIECQQLDEDLASGMKNAKSAVQHRVGALNPAKRNAGLAVLAGLETGLVYSCNLAANPTTTAEDGEGRVQSRGVYIEPGFPKVLRDTSEGGAKCVTGRTVGMVNQTAIFVEGGCSGVFLLPGRDRRAPAMGLMCSSAEGTRTECYLGREEAEGAAGPRALGADGDGAPRNEAIEVYWQTSRRDCVPGKTFGFASDSDMFVLEGCEGQFLVYRSQPDAGTAADVAATRDSFVVDCRGDSREYPAYSQKIGRRRWWCLWICKTQGDDPNGFYTCPLDPMPNADASGN